MTVNRIQILVISLSSESTAQLKIRTYTMRFLSSILPVILVVLLACTSQVKNDCTQFKTGDFEYRTNGLLYAISRKDSLQTETNKINGGVTKTSIKWLNDCSYQLRFLETSQIYPDSIDQLIRTTYLTIEVLNWTDYYYVYIAKSNLTDYVMTDTLWIKHK